MEVKVWAIGWAPGKKVTSQTVLNRPIYPPVWLAGRGAREQRSGLHKCALHQALSALLRAAPCPPPVVRDQSCGLDPWACGRWALEPTFGAWRSGSAKIRGPRLRPPRRYGARGRFDLDPLCARPASVWSSLSVRCACRVVGAAGLAWRLGRQCSVSCLQLVVRCCSHETPSVSLQSMRLWLLLGVIVALSSCVRQQLSRVEQWYADSLAHACRAS